MPRAFVKRGNRDQFAADQPRQQPRFLRIAARPGYQRRGHRGREQRRGGQRMAGLLGNQSGRSGAHAQPAIALGNVRGDETVGGEHGMIGQVVTQRRVAIAQGAKRRDRGGPGKHPARGIDQHRLVIGQGERHAISPPAIRARAWPGY